LSFFLDNRLNIYIYSAILLLIGLYILIRQ
jgi:hypothetical protein